MYRIILYLFVVLLLYSTTISADDDSTVVVKVNGSPIMLSEVEREIDKLIPRSFFHRNVSPEKRERFRKDAIERLIDRELQFHDAKAQRLKAEKKEIKDKIKEIEGRFKSNSEFKEALKKNNMTLKDMEARITKDIIIEKVIKKEVDNKIEVKDEEIKAHYENNIQRYKEMEQVKLRYIVIKFNEGQEAKGEGQEKNKTRNKKEAKAWAEELLARIKKGEDFVMIAYNHSEDAYKFKSGDIGYIHKGRMIPALENVAFSMNIGEVSEPIETEGGFYIIRVEDKKQERQLSFEEVKDKIKKELEDKKKDERMKKWLTALRAKAKIEYFIFF